MEDDTSQHVSYFMNTYSVVMESAILLGQNNRALRAMVLVISERKLVSHPKGASAT